MKKGYETLMRKMLSFFGTSRSTNLSLERVDYFGISEYFSGKKKTKNLYEQNFDSEANGSAVVDFFK